MHFGWAPDQGTGEQRISESHKASLSNSQGHTDYFTAFTSQHYDVINTSLNLCMRSKKESGNPSTLSGKRFK